MSVVNVVLATDGLFLTLGKMMPPFREMGFEVLCGMAFTCAALAFALAPAGSAVVVGVWIVVDGCSVSSSISEYLKGKSRFASLARSTPAQADYLFGS